MPEYPLTQICVEHFVAERPRDMGIVGMRSTQNQRQGCDHFRQRRMLLVHPHIQLLEIAHPRGNVGDLIKGHGFAPRSPAR